MAKIFDSSFDTSSAFGEFFWHATTIENIFKMIQYNDDGLKPVGTGQLGNGFYLTGTRSDYQKAMARRNRKEVTADVPLFLLYVFVKDFYRLKPNFLDGWSTAAGEEDFSAVCWYMDGSGGINQLEHGVFIPSASDGKRVPFKYGQYKGESIADADFASKSGSEKIQYLMTLWSFASKGARPSYDQAQVYPDALKLAMLGPKVMFKRSLLELALKSQGALANSAVVGAMLFSPTTRSLSLQFNYSNKSYDLNPVVVEPSAIRQDDNPLNFHDELWVDLDGLTRILGT